MFSFILKLENTDVTTKRIRIADYIAQVYATRLNYSLYSLADLGRRVTLAKIKQRLYTTPLYLLNQISGLSNLIEYRDMVNDNDATVALKYTYKGISGLGEDGSSVQPVYRYVDPSHVGILDLDASSASDPGMSGMICPMAKIYGHDKSFSVYEEPNEWRENYQPIKDEYYKGKKSPITFNEPYEGEIAEKFLNNRQKIVDEELEINKVRCPISNINDPTILYTCSAADINYNKPKVERKSLFTIHPNNDN